MRMSSFKILHMHVWRCYSSCEYQRLEDNHCSMRCLNVDFQLKCVDCIIAQLVGDYYWSCFLFKGSEMKIRRHIQSDVCRCPKMLVWVHQLSKWRATIMSLSLRSQLLHFRRRIQTERLRFWTKHTISTSIKSIVGFEAIEWNIYRVKSESMVWQIHQASIDDQ